MANISRIARNNPNYQDLDLDFLPHPVTGDVVRKTGIDAIKRSVRNLILTNFYDRKFRSYIGSNAQKILFDNINPLTTNYLKDAIIEVLTNYEPRVALQAVKVTASPDENGYNVGIAYTEVNRSEPAIINLFLERLR